jgi:surface protein
MERSQRFDLSSLPDDIIIKILNLTFDTDVQSNIAKTFSINIINKIITTNPIKVRILDFLNTAQFIRVLISIGIFNSYSHSSHLEWCNTIKKYINQYITEHRYTSRVHDLIDISKSSLNINIFAKCLLNNLITPDTDTLERQFLLGEMTNIPVFDNNTIIDQVNTRSFDNIKYWDVRKVTDISNLFNFFLSHIDVDLTYWDTSNVTNMSKSFSGINIFINGITNWNTCRVINMEYCFFLSPFNQPLEWNTSNVINMHGMFEITKNFNQHLNWDTRNVRTMSHMFRSADSFNQFLEWDTRNVTDMSHMFDGARFFNGFLLFNTSNVTHMNSMFRGAISFNESVVQFTTSKVVDMNSMFYKAIKFNQYLHKWNTSNVEDMRHMFNEAIAFNKPLNSWITEKVENMNSMFRGASSFNQPLNNWDTRKVKDMSYMFYNSISFSQVLDMIYEGTNITNIFTGSQGTFA